MAFAQEILNDARCLKDPFTLSFLSVWCSAPLPTSAACVAELFALAALLKFDICEVECRHAFVRRHLVSRTQAPGESMLGASSAFVLCRQRILENAGWPRRRTREQERKEQREKRKAAHAKCRRRWPGKFAQHRTGGGGKRRAALSELLKAHNAGGRLSTADRRARFREAHRHADAASADTQARWSTMGLAATASHRAGSRYAFGKRSRPQRGDEAPPARTRRLPEPLQAVEAHHGHTARSQALLQAVQAHREQEFRTALVKHTEATRRREELQEERQKAVQSWSERAQASASAGLSVPAMVPAAGAHAAPITMGVDMDYVQWTPPATQMVRRALGGSQRRLAQQHNLCKQLLDAWSARHQGVRARTLPQLTVEPERTRGCYVVGECICKDTPDCSVARMLSRKMQAEVLQGIDGFLKPKSSGRALYDQGLAPRLHSRFQTPTALKRNPSTMHGYVLYSRLDNTFLLQSILCHTPG